MDHCHKVPVYENMTKGIKLKLKSEIGCINFPPEIRNGCSGLLSFEEIQIAL